MSVPENTSYRWFHPALPKETKGRLTECIEGGELILAFAILSQGSFPTLEGQVHPDE
jgi:hypothetical protein